jgi:hypothetical protein
MCISLLLTVVSSSVLVLYDGITSVMSTRDECTI